MYLEQGLYMYIDFFRWELLHDIAIILVLYSHTRRFQCEMHQFGIQVAMRLHGRGPYTYISGSALCLKKLKIIL